MNTNKKNVCSGKKTIISLVILNIVILSAIAFIEYPTFFSQTKERSGVSVAATRELSNNQDSLLLNRVYYLVQTAKMALVLKNPTLALDYLNEANGMLADSANPFFIKIHNALNSDINKLKGVAYANIADVALKIEVVNGLMMELISAPKDLEASSQKAEEKNTSEKRWGWRNFWQQSSEMLSRAFIIRRQQQGKPTFLLYEERYELILNLQSKMQIAAWAILHDQDQLYKANIEQTITILQNNARYFPGASVNKILLSLQGLKGVVKTIPLDLQPTLSLIKAAL